MSARPNCYRQAVQEIMTAAGGLAPALREIKAIAAACEENMSLGGSIMVRVHGAGNAICRPDFIAKPDGTGRRGCKFDLLINGEQCGRLYWEDGWTAILDYKRPDSGRITYATGFGLSQSQAINAALNARGIQAAETLLEIGLYLGEFADDFPASDFPE